MLTAVSDDDGYTFGPPEQVVIDPAADEGVTMYRDPFVWRADDRWLMVVGAGYADEVAAIRLYSSPDLRTWTRLDDLCSTPRRCADGIDTGSAWECPQILQLGEHSIAVVGTWSPTSGPIQLLAFPADDPAHPTLVDHGTSLYAASALRDSPHGPLLFGWVTEDREPAVWAEAGWAGALSLPRQVWWEEGSLRSAPVPTAANLRSGESRPAEGATVGAQCEIELPTAPARLRLRFDDTQQLEITADADSNSLTIERTDGTAGAGRTVSASAAFQATSSRPAVRVFIDGSIVEVFTSAGRVLTTRAYPTTPPPWPLDASTDAVVWDLDAGAKNGVPAERGSSTTVWSPQ